MGRPRGNETQDGGVGAGVSKGDGEVERKDACLRHLYFEREADRGLCAC